MKVKVNQDECSLIKLSLVSLAKENKTNENAMFQLLLLSRKFIWKLEKKEKEINNKE